MHDAATSTMPAGRLQDPLLALLAGVIASVTVLWACGGGDVLGGRPVQFSADAVFHYALAKTVLDDGWTWHAARLGSPFSCDLLAFGLDLPVESALLRLLALTTDDCIALLNRGWILLCGLAAAGGYAAFRLLGMPRSVALVCGCLYATTPYVYFRSVTHFNAHVAFVPVPTAAAVLLLTDGLRGLGRFAWLGVCGACFLVGLGFIYYSFFTALLLVHAVAIAWLTGHGGSIGRGVVCLALVVVGAALNLAPVLADWARYGRPVELADRQPQHADLFALRIRDLILPSEHTPVPGLRRIGREVDRVAWPLPTESRFAKLGTVGAVGFVICLWVLVGVRPPGDQRHAAVTRAAASLALILVMVGVAGGFGSIFNLFVSPMIRCYNRVMPLLAVLVLVPCASLLHAAMARCRIQAMAMALPAALLAFGLVEQNAARVIRDQAAGWRAERQALETFVHEFERDAGHAAAVLMLPATPFPHDYGTGTMATYDHAKPYLFSRHLRWSWPMFGPAQRALMATLDPAAGPAFVSRARDAGFRYAWIDRRAAQAAAHEAAVAAGGGRLLCADATDRYRIYQLAEAADAG